ncbi:MFS general substrate transporter [Xylariaceae sp. FL0804]|nr:MFS general substrate transporter [Xylariaceae sp. FL0804]
MASSVSYYVRHLFSSSYGDKRPDFFIWYPKGTSKSEKKLLFKIDFFILTYGCLGYLVKWLDQANLSNAYVSGMQQDLKMFDNQYNLAQTCFNIGSIIGPIPSNILLTFIPPRLFLPGMELIWGLVTIGTYAVKDVNQLYPLRFVVGFLEGSSFTGMQYILGSWYKKTEIGKRTAIFSCAAYVGTMISGYIQSGVLASLDGHGGLPAWRWVFIIDGVLTVVIALYGMVFFPDTPDKTRAFYFTPDERARCVERMAEDGVEEETRRFSWRLLARALRTWQLYVLTVLFMFWNTTVGKVANTVMQLFLQNDTEHDWSIYQVNNIPTAINGWDIVMILALNVYVDATGRRMAAVALNLAILIFGTVCLVVWNIPLGLKIVAYMFAGTDGPLSPIYYAWANILTAGDSQLRTLTLAIMNSAGSALTTVIQQFLYPVSDAPEYSKGFKASLGFVCGMCVWVVVVRVFEMREQQQQHRRSEADPTDVESPTAYGVAVLAEPKA